MSGTETPAPSLVEDETPDDAADEAYARAVDARAEAARTGVPAPTTGEVRDHEELGRALSGTPFFQAPATLGRFEQLALIGEGGMSVVLSAWDPKYEHQVALKIPTRSASAEWKALLREARSVRSLGRHENICQIFSVEEVQGGAFLCMELIEGDSLWDRRAEFRDPRRAASLVATLADTIGYAHDKRKIVHRDIKMPNVMLRRGTDVPVLIDFGVAKRLGATQMTEVGALKGTRLYMSPEQANGGEVDHSTDLFALGLMLCELVTDKHPQSGRGDPQTWLNIKEGRSVRMRSLDPSVPRALDDIVAHCLERDPAARYQRGQTLAEDLRNFLSGKPLSISRDSLVAALGHAVKRHRKKLALIGAIVAAVVGPPIAVWVHGNRNARRAAAQAARAQAATSLAVAGDVQKEAKRLLEDLQTVAGWVLQEADRAPLVDALRAWNARGARSGMGDQSRRARAQDLVDKLPQMVGKTKVTNWQLLDVEGVMVARWPEDSARPVIGKKLAFRDYFSGAREHAGKTGLDRVHVALAYNSVADGRYKVALSVPILDHGQFIGVLAASNTVDRQLPYQMPGLRLIEVAPLEAPESRMVVLVHPALTDDQSGLPFPPRALGPLSRRARTHEHELDLPEPAQITATVVPEFHDPLDPLGAEAQLAVAAPIGATGYLAIIFLP